MEGGRSPANVPSRMLLAMSSSPNHQTPSAAAQQALQAITELSARERLWVLEQMETQQTLDVGSLSPEWRTELAARLQSLQDGRADLHDLEDVEQEALRLLEE